MGTIVPTGLSPTGVGIFQNNFDDYSTFIAMSKCCSNTVYRSPDGGEWRCSACAGYFGLITSRVTLSNVWTIRRGDVRWESPLRSWISVWTGWAYEEVGVGYVA